MVKLDRSSSGYFKWYCTSIREDSFLAPKKLKNTVVDIHFIHAYAILSKLFGFFLVKNQFIISEIFYRAYRPSEGWNEFFRSEIP